MAESMAYPDPMPDTGPVPTQRPIEAHGIIGDMRTAALIADDGAVDFFCWPEFDSPSVFVSLLDTPRAGAFELSPDLPDARRMQVYLPDTNVLLTRWLDEAAIVELTDLMPVNDTDDVSRIVRTIKAVHGRARIRLRCAVRHDYARADTRARNDGGDVCFDAEGQPSMRLSGSTPLSIDDNAAVADLWLEEGQTAEFVLGGADDPFVRADDALNCFRRTMEYWRGWLSQSRYTGRWREYVARSALALKLLTSRRHGGILAAATFGLPEDLGGERNWDYRYTWIRDASFTIYAFMRLGFTEEANAFMHWASERVPAYVETNDDTDHDPHKILAVMYTVDGNPDLKEESLDHLKGYANSRPVRIGNEAYKQVQHDIYGELLDGVYLSNKYGEAISHKGWRHVIQIVDQACRDWRTPDVGIWEMRGESQHFLHSRLMCWVAIDRAIRLAQKRSLPAPFERWNAERAAIHDDIWENFFDKEAGHFVQRLGSRALDGAMLLMPLVRFVGATDPCWLATLDAIRDRLVRDGMVKRYLMEETPCDGLEGDEGAFAACSFWYVECLARAGRVDEARSEFEKLLTYANPLGLYAEEFDRRGRHLGNTPQALTHLALISAASFLDRKLSGDETHWQP
ncbi:glycoside hydrolase family 15 protein [Pigmentiphaga litoralis]|uniref:glycoside hydrolase family 15 protein n=1 Tax=Pigmentiphaga litoralis TaxID=516702 RepID=UPI003B4283C3